MLIIDLLNSSLSFVATPPFAPVITDAPSDKRAFNFFIFIPSSSNFFVMQVTIASALGETSGECSKRVEQSRNAVSAFPLSTSKILNDISWHIFDIPVTSSVNNAYTVDSPNLEHPLSRTSVYLEQFSLSLGYFHLFQPNFLSLSRTSISRTSLYLEQKVWSHANFSLPISNFSAFAQPIKAGFHSAYFPSGGRFFSCPLEIKNLSENVI